MFRKFHERYKKFLENETANYWMREWVEPIVIALILALIIRTFFLQAFKIPTGSMRDTLIEGDRILVTKCLYWFREPKLGDVIVFKYPLDRKRDFIKRLVGEPGSTVKIEDGNIFVDGKQVEDPEIIRKNYYYSREDWPYGKNGVSIKVPQDSYFALGDNSAQSSDSRYWGFVPRKDVKGKAFFIYWPPSRWQVVH